MTAGRQQTKWLHVVGRVLSASHGKRRRSACICSLALLVLFASAGGPGSFVLAQTQPQSEPENQTKPEKESVAKQARVTAHAQRIAQLEEQVVDLQVAIGTLESLSDPSRTKKGRAFSVARAQPSTSEKVLETQVGALSEQVESLRNELRALQTAGAATGLTFNTRSPAQPQVGPPPVAANSDGFGATVISRADTPAAKPGDTIGALIEREELRPLAPSAKEQAVAARPAEPPAQSRLDPTAVPNEQARTVYQAAYNLLLQQDFAGAQKGFRAFLREFPKDNLVPNALYWLGETYYVQENYTDAAEAFDIVTAAYGASNKAPDSQLKRGMALANLGKRREACSVLGALAKRFPNAPDYVKTKAASERSRVGCG